MKNKILLLSPFFYPEQISTGKYNSFLVGELVNKGFDVDVISFHPFYPEWIVKKSGLEFKNVGIYRYGEKVKFPNSQILRRIILEIAYSYCLVKHMIIHKKTYDYVVSIFPPVLFMLFSRAFFKSSMKIGIVHDVQGIMAKTEVSFSRKISATIMGAVEKITYRWCDRLICLSHSMKKAVIENFGVDEKKCEVFYPFISIPCSTGQFDSELLSSFFEKGYRHVVYSGALGEKQMPFQLFELFMAVVNRYKDIKCHIFSRGPLFDKLVNHSIFLNEPHILFHDLVPEKELENLFSKSTIQVIPQAPNTGAGAFPSKLPNLFAYGVPVFAICDKGSELDVVINKVEHAESVNSWDINILSQELYLFVEKVSLVSHEDILIKNKETILKEFDVDIFIESIVK